ncbi:MAG: DUF3467 domain-containing protein [Elusimicrobiales bacterium]|nr:DUF3467 domain-containing protein [Elusimicrobiales bacterium]
MKEKEPKQLQLEIQMDEQTAKGIYTNLAGVMHSETEFVLDFLFLQPNQLKAKLRARIISSPVHTKRFVNTLIENIKRYEDRFGVIPEREALLSPEANS